jgi:hypothetical protein
VVRRFEAISLALRQQPKTANMQMLWHIPTTCTQMPNKCPHMHTRKEKEEGLVDFSTEQATYALRRIPVRKKIYKGKKYLFFTGHCNNRTCLLSSRFPQRGDRIKPTSKTKIETCRSSKRSNIITDLCTTGIICNNY